MLFRGPEQVIGDALGALRADAGQLIKLLDELVYRLGSLGQILVNCCFLLQPYPLSPLPLAKGKGRYVSF